MTLLSCSRTAPSPMALASVCKTNGFAPTVNWGYTKIGAYTSLHFSVVNAAAHASVHTKGTFFESNCAMGWQFPQIS